MTRAAMPGRAHLQAVPACTLAQDFSDDERAFLAELGVDAPPVRLQLVPRTPRPAATPAADLRRARARGDLALWIAAASIAAALLLFVLGRLDGLTP